MSFWCALAYLWWRLLDFKIVQMLVVQKETEIKK